MAPKNKPALDTSQELRHVFACRGETMHITPGTELLKRGDANTCPQCGATLYDATDTPVGRSYFAFVRQDLGVQQ